MHSIDSYRERCSIAMIHDDSMIDILQDDNAYQDDRREGDCDNCSNIEWCVDIDDDDRLIIVIVTP
jgi:hypothetical protein